MSVLLAYRHSKNIGNLLAGTEGRIGGKGGAAKAGAKPAAKPVAHPAAKHPAKKK